MILAAITIALLPAPACNDPFAHSRCKYTKIQVLNTDRTFEAEIQNWTCKSEVTIGKPAQQVIVRLIDHENEGLSEGVFSISGKHIVTANWTDPTHLEIKCEDVQDSEIAAKLESWGGVTITYILK